LIYLVCPIVCVLAQAVKWKGEPMRRCPGQDRRFWKPEDIIDVDCASCGRELEFFKAEPLRRCPGCGDRVSNPSVSLGCARWCRYARECLGFDPRTAAAGQKSGKEQPMVKKLLDKIGEEFGDNPERVSHAIKVLEKAERILQEEKAAPRVVLAAALLHDIGMKEAERKHGSAAPRFQELEGPPVARRLLEDFDFSEEDTEHICRIIADHHSGMEDETPEFRVVWDAYRLAGFCEEYPDAGGREKQKLLEKPFQKN